MKGRRIFLLASIFSSLGLAFFVFRTRLLIRAANYEATITSFTVDSSSLGATGVTYTLEFKFSQDFVGGTGSSANLILKRIVTQQGADVTSNMASATGSISSFQYQDSNGAWQTISYDNNSFSAQISDSFLVYHFSDITTNIPANRPIRLVIGGVTNPSKAGSYAFDLSFADANGNNFSVEPYNNPERTVRVDIGDYCFKVKITAPDGTTAMPGLDVFVDSADHSFNTFLKTDYLGFVSFYSDGFTGLTNCPSGSNQKVYLFINIGPDSSNPNHYFPPEPTVLTLPTNQDTYVSNPIKLVQASKTISGTITYSDGSGGVSGARINAFQPDTGQFTQTTSGSDGSFTLYVGGGTWEVMPEAQSDSNWAYGAPPERVSFQENTESESATVNFSVDKATASVTGRLLKPDGTPVSPSEGYGVGVFSMEGKGGGGPVGNNGVFQINVPAGRYQFEVWTPPDSTYGSPGGRTVEVKEGETVDLGDITLVTKDATIQGAVKVAGTNTGVANVTINAFVRDGGGFAMTTTDADGNFSLSVTSGTWMVMPMFDPSANYALTDPPQEVRVASGETATVTISVESATATIRGSLVDSNGNLVSVYGYAFAETPGGEMFGPGGMGGPIERGTFSFKVPAGSYNISAVLAPGSNYTVGQSQSVTVADGQTGAVTISLVQNNATITGSILDQDGNAVSPSDFFVFAVSETGGHKTFQEGTVNGSSYTIQVAAGEWSLGYFVDPSTGYMSAPPDPSLRFTVNSGETVVRNITLHAANSTITGRVTKPDGSAAVGVFVSADNRETEGGEFMNGAPTNNDGYYTIRIAAGSYKLRANVAPGSGYLSPAEQTVTVADGESKTVNFTLRESNATITGQVTLNGAGKPAFVYAWSEDGGFTQTQANASGNYSLSASTGTIWHVGARYESGTSAYEASETRVDLTSANSGTANLALASLDYNLPEPYSVTFDATKPKIITLSDGTEINIPANALATSGNVTLSIEPKVSLPAKKGDRPVWYGYEFTAINSSGQTITQFNSNITITFPYTDAQLNKLGITADDLIPSYWDDTSGTWKKVDNVTVDTTAKTVTITINHFTNFALTANYTRGTTSSTSSGATSGTNASGGVSKPMAPKETGSIVEGATNKVVWMIPAGALEWDADFEMTQLREGFEKPKPPLWIASGPYQVTMKAWWNGAKFSHFRKPVTLIIRYDPTALGNIPEESLRLNYYDPAKKRWRPLNSLLITDRHEVAAVVSQVHGLYALIGGFGYQGAPQYLEETVTATARSEEIGLKEDLLPKREVREELSKSSEDQPVIRSSPSPEPEPSVAAVKPKESWFKRLLKKIFPFLR